MDTLIRETAPTAGTLVDGHYERPDYRDAFVVSTSTFATVDDFATAYFLEQPHWLTLVISLRAALTADQAVPA